MESETISREAIWTYRGSVELLGLEEARVTGVDATAQSMSPTLSRTSKVAYVPVDPVQVRVGDILVYDHPVLGVGYAHRVVELGEDAQGWYAITKGDHNIWPDREPVREAHLRGRVVAIFY